MVTAYGTYDAMMIEALRALNEKIEKLEYENQNLREANLLNQTVIKEIREQIAGIKASVNETIQTASYNQTKQR